MLAGIWILVFLPLVDAFKMLGWASAVPVPTIFDFRGTVRSLNDTLLFYRGVFQPLVFCIGVVLLFSRERDRRQARLDWTRRWGILCSYVVLLLSASGIFIIAALVLAGIASVFQGMPLKHQPQVTRMFAEVSSAYLRYGAQPTNIAIAVTVAFSSIAILLACIPLFDALRSSGPKRLAALLLAPLALFAVLHLAQAGRYCLPFSGVTSADLFPLHAYFGPELLTGYIGSRIRATGVFPRSGLGMSVLEAAKWCIVLAIALWLSIAQLAAWWQRRKPRVA